MTPTEHERELGARYWRDGWETFPRDAKNPELAALEAAEERARDRYEAFLYEDARVAGFAYSYHNPALALRAAARFVALATAFDDAARAYDARANAHAAHARAQTATPAPEAGKEE